jgi:hypothetical protein
MTSSSPTRAARHEGNLLIDGLDPHRARGLHRLLQSPPLFPCGGPFSADLLRLRDGIARADLSEGDEAAVQGCGAVFGPAAGGGRGILHAPHQAEIVEVDRGGAGRSLRADGEAAHAVERDLARGRGHEALQLDLHVARAGDEQQLAIREEGLAPLLRRRVVAQFVVDAHAQEDRRGLGVVDVEEKAVVLPPVLGQLVRRDVSGKDRRLQRPPAVAGVFRGRLDLPLPARPRFRRFEVVEHGRAALALCLGGPRAGEHRQQQPGAH